jgi:carboxylesterase type B
MIHGCSAGGVSIANHLVQPLSWPFFTSAAMESGNQLTFTDAVSMADAQASYDGLRSGLGCSSLECLLALNTSQVLNAPFRVHASPVVDGVNLVDFPRRLLRAGKIKRCGTRLLCAILYSKRSFPQGRLGTDIEKSREKRRVLAGCRRLSARRVTRLPG